MYREDTQHAQPKIDNNWSPVAQMHSKAEGIETPADAPEFLLAEYKKGIYIYYIYLYYSSHLEVVMA